ncbi:MAG: hypothetical protein ABIL05_03230 [candidate division WOR-3 bacterium]
METIGLLQNRFRIIRHYLTPHNFREIVKILSFIIVISIFMIGSFLFFFKVFKYLKGIEAIGSALITKTIETAFFIFFNMLVFSNIITSFSTFYRSGELNLLFSLPIPPKSIFLAKFLENSFYASWATLIFSLPLILSFGLIMQVDPIYYPLTIIALIPFMIIPTSIGSLITIFLSKLFPGLKPREIIITSLILIGGLSFLYIRASNPAIFKIFETENEEDLIKFVSNLGSIGAVYLPSTWLVHILNGFLPVFHLEGLQYFLVLIFTGVSTLIIATLISDRIYRSSYLSIAEQMGGRVKKKGKSLLIKYGGTPGRSILLKDILIFIRDPSQSVQLIIFFGLIIIYIFSLRRTPIYFTIPLWRTVIAFANLGYVSFVLATLGVRFIFPAISLEGESIWFLRSAPITTSKVFKIKYLFNLIVVFLLIEILSLMCNLVIKTDTYFIVLSALVFIFVGASFVSINLGLGALLPQFNESNPSKIASGAGGVFAALASLAYVGILVTILAGPVHSILTSHFWGRHMRPSMIVLSVIAFIVLNFTATFVPISLGIKSLKDCEI